MLVGTLYPLALEALTGARISVGAPFFNLTFVPLVVPLLIIVPFGPLLAWKRGDLVAAAQRLIFAFGIAIARRGRRGGRDRRRRDALALFGVWLGAWLIAGALSELAFRVKLGGAPLGESLRRAHRPAALRLRHDARPCRRRHDSCSASSRHDLGRRGDPLDEAGRHGRTSPATR